MKKPTFLCIGAQKAGTTWLSKMLERHPSVWIPPVKELHYFDYVHLKEMNMPDRRLKALKNALDKKCAGEAVSMNYLQYLSRLALFREYNDRYYMSLFQPANKPVIGELTPEYSMLNEEGVAHIKRLLGDVKLIFILRNPVQRAWSFARMYMRARIAKGEEIPAQAWIKLLNKPGNRIRTDYKRTIECYENEFDMGRILYLFYDEICYEPLKVLSQVCSFLEIPFEEEIFKKIVGERHNVNPAVNIPEEVLHFLQQEFNCQEDFVRNRFNPARFEL